MNNQPQYKHLKLSLGAIVCTAFLFGCSHSKTPLNASTKTSSKSSPTPYVDTALAKLAQAEKQPKYKK